MNKCDNCLADCLQIRTLCECQDCNENYYLNDFVPSIRLSWFSDLATEEHGTGAALAKQLIKGAEIAVLSDIMQANIQGVGINRALKSDCSKCNFTSVYTKDTGLIVEAIHSSDLNQLVIPKLSFQTDFTGTANLIICDPNDNNTVLFTAPVQLVTGVPQNVTLNNNPFDVGKVLIKFDNPEIGLSNINCPKSGCNCNKKKPQGVRFLGYVNGMQNSQQYGFVPCVNLTCNPDNLICTVLSNMKPIVAKAIAYKVSISLYEMMCVSTTWKETQLNIDTAKVESNIETLMGLYREIIFGSKAAYQFAGTSGIVKTIQQTAKTMTKDHCIVCNARMYSTSGIR